MGLPFASPGATSRGGATLVLAGANEEDFTLLLTPTFSHWYCSSTGKKWETWAHSVEVTLALTTLQFYIQLKALQRHKVQVSKLSRSHAQPSVLKVPGTSPKRIFCLCPSPCAWVDMQPLSPRSPCHLWSSRLEISGQEQLPESKSHSINLRGLLAIKYGDPPILARVESSLWQPGAF